MAGTGSTEAAETRDDVGPTEPRWSLWGDIER